MGIKIPRSTCCWSFNKLRRDDKRSNNNRDDDGDDDDDKSGKEDEVAEEEEEDPRGSPVFRQWIKFGSSVSWSWSLSWMKKKKKKKKNILMSPIRLSCILDDMVFRVLYVMEAIVLVATFCFYFCCCGCHV